MLYDLLCLIGLDVHICDAREARLIGQNRVKTDKNDAYRLTALLKSGFLPECYVSSGDCRDLVRARASAWSMATRIKNPYSDLFGKAG